MDLIALVLRLVLLSGTSVVAGMGLLRPAANSISSPTRLVAWISAALAALAALLSVFLVEVEASVAVLHTLLALVLAALLRFPRVSAVLGFTLGLLLLAETALGSSSLDFVSDLLCTAGGLVWLGMCALASTAPAGQRPTDTPRAGPLALGTALALAVAAVVRMPSSGMAIDRRLYETEYGLTLSLCLAASAVTVIGTAVLVRRGASWQVYRLGAVGVVAVVLSNAALPALALPPELPVPGVPQLAHVSPAGHPLPLLVSPHRPGKNLVHFPESAGDDLTVRASGRVVHAVARPGTSGTWAEVALPPGHSDLVVERAGAEDSVELDTGTAGGPPSAVGPDGPECASAALGGLLAGTRQPLTRCPSDGLAPEDADALGELIRFISANGARRVALVADDSPRARQAADVVRSSADNLTVVTGSAPRPGDALVLVSGWDAAGATLRQVGRQDSRSVIYPRGLYLAPWLLHAPMLNSVASSLVPLRFDPRESRSLTYGMTLARSFGGEYPSVAGFRRWLSARREQVTGPVAVYAAAQVDVMKMRIPGMPGMTMHGSPPVGQWNPHGTVVAVSGALPS